MNLVEKLREVLGQDGILPTDPAKALIGSDLLKKVKPLVVGYSDNSIRQTFSALISDPTSPIARVEQGYGYYRRVTAPQPVVESEAAQQGEASAPTEGTPPAPIATGRNRQPEEKFRAFFVRYARLNSSFPVHVEHTSGTHQPAGVNKWKFPDVVVLDWEVGEQRGDGFALDRALLEVKRSLGEQPFRLSSVELKVELSLANFREHFFQCVSNSKWAHVAQLAVATAVSDSLLAQELRRLGASYGVTIMHFGLTRDRLDSLPDADKILSMSEDEFEKLAPEAQPTALATGAARGDLDWDHIRDMRAQSADFRELFGWVARCLSDARAYSIENYRQLQEIERQAG
jgi:hypothetical protein